MIRSSTDTVEYLVIQAQRDSVVELEKLLQIYYPKLMRLAQIKLRDNDAAKDIVQETVIRVVQNLPALKNPAAFNGWTQQILNRCCIAYFKREKKLRPSEQEMEDLISFGADTAAEEPDDRQYAGLIEAIEALGDKSQEVVRMHYFFGLSVKEIAFRVRVSVGAVKVRLHRARNELRDHLHLTF